MLAIIPARGGSKGLPGKNISPFLGHPLIAWTIDCAKNCGLFDKIIVSTDSVDIADVARAYGAQVIERPAALSTDTASPKDAVIHTVNQLEKNGYEPSHLALLQPTSPLKTPDDIKACNNLIFEKKFDTAATYCPAIPHPDRAYFVDENNRAKPVLNPEKVWLPRQARTPQFHLNGAVYLVAVEPFLKDNSKQFLLPGIGAHIMPSERSVDIDTKIDLKLCELLMDNRKPPAKINQ